MYTDAAAEWIGPIGMAGQRPDAHPLVQQAPREMTPRVAERAGHGVDRTLSPATLSLFHWFTPSRIA
jgi:hypothetical protein